MPSPLGGYTSQVQSLLDDFGAVEYTTANLTTYINDARVQIAGASESIRGQALLTLVVGQQQYHFTDATGRPPGTAGLLSVRMVRRQTPAGGWLRVEMRPWEYFYSFRLCTTVPVSAVPTMVAQLNPGVAGTLWFDPIPDFAYVIGLDAVLYPSVLTGVDGELELIPVPWTEAIQYYAAYLALLNAQRQSDADAMFARYQLFEQRATQITTASRLPGQYPGGQAATIAAGMVPLTGAPGGRRG